MNQKLRSVSFVLFLAIYIIPVFLVTVRIIPYEQRYSVLIVTSILMVAYLLARRISLRELGLSKQHLVPSLAWNLGIAAGLSAILFILYHLGLIREPTIPEWNWFFVFYIFCSCPLQEFLYRGAFFAELKRRGITSGPVLVAISALNFGSLHLIYHDWITFLAGVFMGLVWGVVYQRYPNLWGVAVSHALAGSVSIFVGLI